MDEYEASNGQCTNGGKSNYGITKVGNSIWVNYGCRAKFRVCYEKGQCYLSVILHASSRLLDSCKKGISK